MELAPNLIRERKRIKETIKKKYSKDDYLKEAKVFRLSVYDTKQKKIARTVFVHSIIRQKEEVLVRLKELMKSLSIPSSFKLYTIGDGAKWVKDLLDSIHTNSEFLLDYYHASSYVSKVGLLKFFTKRKLGKKQSRKFRSKLKKRGGRAIIAELKKLVEEIKSSSLSKKDKENDLEIIDGVLGYLEPRIDQMNYKKQTNEGRPIGSGFIESACKQIVKQRLGLSGGRFYLEAAERIMQLRCIIMMEAWNLLTDLMYRKQFQLEDCQPSSSYEPVIHKAA